MLDFNFQYIKNLASPGVWRRGYSYYQTKQVEKVELCEEGIQGKVKGNFRDEYTTILKLSEDNVKAECDCPFPDEWCKHAVAVALIGISEGLWKKYWGIEDTVIEEDEKYEGSYRFYFSEKSKPKTVAIKVIDRNKDVTVTEIEPILRDVIEAQKRNLIQLNDIQKKELYVLTFLHKLGQLDTKRKHFYIYYNNLTDLLSYLSGVDDFRNAQTKQRMRVESNPLKLIMNINLSMVGNVLVALHWKRTNPDDSIPYEEVKLFAKRVQWGIYNNIIFPIETKVGELPYFLSKSSFLDIRGGDGGKFLFQQLPKFKESLEGELELEEADLIKNARLEVKPPKKVLTIEMPDESTIRAALEFDYDGMRVPYLDTAHESPYVCVVKNAPPPKQYSIEEFREQEAAKRKAEIEAGIIDPSKEEKKFKKVIRVKVIGKPKKGVGPKKVASADKPEQEIILKEGKEEILQSVEDISDSEDFKVCFNDSDFADYDEDFTHSDTEDNLFEASIEEKELDLNVFDANSVIDESEVFESGSETEYEYVDDEPEVFESGSETEYEYTEEEMIGTPLIKEAEEIGFEEEIPVLRMPDKKQVRQKKEAGLSSFDNLLDSLVPQQPNVLSQNLFKASPKAPKRHKVIEDVDIIDKIFSDSSSTTKKTKKSEKTKDTTEPKKKGTPPKKAKKDLDSIEETIVSDEIVDEIDDITDVTNVTLQTPEEIYWIKRNIELEKQTYKELIAASLTPVQTNKLEAHDDNVVDFVGKFLPLLKDNEEWIIEYPEEIERIRLADEPAKFIIRIDFEKDHKTFILEVVCQVGKREIKLDEVQELIKEGRKYIYASGTGFAEIPLADSLQLTKTLNSFDANKIEEATFRVLTYKVGLVAELFDQNVEIEMSDQFKVFWDLISSFSNFDETPVPEEITATLREYQKKGFSWLHFMYTYGLNGILADDMGLGKTLQTLTLLQMAKDKHERKPSLVICPTSVVFNWEDEIKKFAPDLKAINFTGATRHSLLNKINSNDVVITSYALIRRDIQHLRKYEFRYIILDEAQKIKNYQSMTANVTKQLRSNHRLALSGTPIENRLSELWSIFDFLTPGFLYDHNEFRYRYAQPIEEHGNRDAERRLKKQVYPFILRRLKQNVAKDLPDKLEFLSYCELLPEQRDIYLDVLEYTREELFRKIEKDGFARSHMSILSALLRLRQICCHPRLIGDVHESQIRNSGKFDHLKDMISDVIDQGHRVLLFSQFVQMLNIIKDHFDRTGIKYEYLTGSTKDRKERVDHFNNDPTVPVFLISLKAGGTGLNLTGADYVIHYDPWWNPAVEDQATDRAHRIGQTKKVFVYRLITKGTVEEKMIKLQEKKRDLIDSVITVDTSLGKILTYEDLKEILSPDF
ncbi:MAG: DEAD/DEAH box helicase [Cyanobacteriota bacterium]